MFGGIFVSNPATGRAYQTGLATLVSIIKGTSIVSLAHSERFIELGLSENLMLRIEGDEGLTVRVTVISTSNADEVPPDRLQLVSDGEESTAALVEDRLHSVRQIYAILLLLYSERQEELASALIKNPAADLERYLIRQEDRLYVQAAGPGSWWITVLTKIGGAPQAAINTLSLIYGEGRRMLLERVRAATDLKFEEVEAKRIANDAARRKAVLDAFSGLEKIKNPEDRERVRQYFLSSVTSANPKLAKPTIAGLLPESESKAH